MCNNYQLLRAMLVFFLFNFIGIIHGVLKFDSQSSTLQLSGSNASLIISTPLNVPGTIKILNKANTSLQATTTDVLSFSDGIYQSSTTGKAFFTGTIDPATIDKLILNSGQALVAESDTFIESIEIRNSGNVIKGQPTFSSPIVLQNSSAELNLGIQNKLSQNITMNGGTLVLTDNLSLQDGVFFTGNGLINLGNNTLTLPSAVASTWTGNLTFLQANDLMLNGYTTLDGTWTFSGASSTSRLNGNGNILDIASGGSLVIDSGHTLYLSDVTIKGLGDNGGSLVFTDSTASLNISNVVFDLSGSYNLTQGTISVQGSNCTVITRNSDEFVVTGLNSILNINGVVFYFDPLGSAVNYPQPIRATSSGTINYLNNGVIRAASISEASGNLQFDIASGSGNNLLQTSFVVGPSANISVTNATPLTPKTMILDGQGFYIQFNYSTNQYISIAENVTLTLQNILLKDFDPSLINFQGSGGTKAKLIFGDNCVVDISKDLTLSSIALASKGNAVINGHGTTMTINAANMITSDVANKVLTLKDMRIMQNYSNGISCLNDNSKIVLQNSTVHLGGAGMTFAQGNLDIRDNCVFEGLDSTVAGGGSPIFTFSSKGLMQVLSGSKLFVDSNLTFSYNPDTTSDGGVASLSKRHVKLVDPSSVLSLHSCSITSGIMGLAFDYGQIYVDGHTYLHVSSTSGAEMEFGSALQVEIAPSGILDVDGILKYTQTTYP